jgi:hypothetical protein
MREARERSCEASRDAMSVSRCRHPMAVRLEPHTDTSLHACVPPHQQHCVRERGGEGELTLEAEALSEAVGKVGDEVHVVSDVLPLPLDVRQVLVEITHQPAS